MSSLTAIRAESTSREAEEKRRTEQRRNALVLILRHLVDHGYLEAAERLQVEAGVSLAKHDVADNVDLLTVIQEFSEYHEVKFGRRPKLTRRVAGGGEAADGPPPTGNAARRNSSSKALGASGNGGGGTSKLPRIVNGSSRRDGGDTADSWLAGHARRKSSTGQDASERPAEDEGAGGEADGGLLVVGTSSRNGPGGGGSSTQARPPADDFFESRMLKPLPDMGSPELRELAAVITRDIYLENPNVHWGSVAGLDDAKRLLREAVVMPHKYPQFFTGLLAPWRGILLYGPPGTGKTMLAKAVATDCRTTFFNISASSIISKWRGDSEKLVRVMFELARYHAPSTIFLDEVDALMGQRGGAESGPGGEHEASRRMKTELLVQLDGLSRSSDLVFLLAATNLPWELDTALLRRLEKRILVPLPGLSARRHILEELLPRGVAPFLDLDAIAGVTGGYSGSDIRLFCKEAAMRPLRRLMQTLENPDPPPLQNASVGPVTEQDMEAALRTTRPSARLAMERYQTFHNEYGNQADEAM